MEFLHNMQAYIQVIFLLINGGFPGSLVCHRLIAQTIHGRPRLCIQLLRWFIPIPLNHHVHSSHFHRMRRYTLAWWDWAVGMTSTKTTNLTISNQESGASAIISTAWAAIGPVPLSMISRTRDFFSTWLTRAQRASTQTTWTFHFLKRRRSLSHRHWPWLRSSLVFHHCRCQPRQLLVVVREVKSKIIPQSNIQSLHRKL